MLCRFVIETFTTNAVGGAPGKLFNIFADAARKTLIAKYNIF
ncbi:hypothetical protein SynRS9902_02737 [Synechococcus sp. RS9902]|nr:hypothetical protein SynRS9902_02737 [Synechococcus sp. RS9902]